MDADEYVEGDEESEEEEEIELIPEEELDFAEVRKFHTGDIMLAVFGRKYGGAW